MMERRSGVGIEFIEQVFYMAGWRVGMVLGAGKISERNIKGKK